ncbi:T9SS C-terminal target domain-containing protein [Flavobacterium arcticum]|uniref:T9SS C-terminal target domain-containing protein n=1 Tax=Flavobacterium arcticum TaxID=1784713 RepID=A0A345HCJ3_9FLAO|nr:choice-of-anchor I family protein [Flavobacterium arcticum]AXG74303.1 T9SS C-terminal target domain-containing protein [Flavobacterium arcticum]KAF2507583.1 T9SS type A sorting domain-containing protein [Flavobacterium arcticum]
MLNNYTKKTLMLLALCMVTFVSSAQDLMHYWNFNAVDGTVEMVAADYSIVAGTPQITYPGTGDGYMDDVSGDILNAQNGDPAGNGLRPRNPSNTRSLVIAFPTTSYENVEVSFAVKRTGSGATEQYYSYSVDGGINYTNAGLATTTFFPTEDYSLVTVDFSAIEDVENNADFIFKIDFGGDNAAGDSGNNRFDNLTVMGTLIDGVEDVTAPLAVFTPANESNFLAITTTPQIVFNEDVRLIDDSVITDANAASLVELRLNDADGATVPFTTTFADNTITIIPSSDLINNQQYYVALLGNMVEDMSNNVVIDTEGIIFTTIAEQTEFSTGDMAFVGYRMNASDAEDEIALVTSVDISEGTFIYLTDSKYTSNTQPQCEEAIMWTATQCVPAGSVITIQTSEMVSNLGSVTGNSFGLSSGGDQVIVYTGSAATPNYITAMSSNAWLADNTSCSGSESMIPAGLVDGVSSVNLSTAPDNVEGNTVNAYYNGIQEGTITELRAAILNPANWVGTDAGTPSQTWPTWAFPSAPTVQNITVVNSTTIVITFNNLLNATSATTVTNYTGIDGLDTAVLDGNTVTLNYTTAFDSNIEYELTINNVEDNVGIAMACAYTYDFAYTTELSFESDFIVVNEDAGTVNVTLNLTNPSTASVDLVVKTAPFSTADTNDFTYTTTTLNFTGTSTLTQTITIPVIDDTEEEQHAEYFVLSLENATGVTLTGETFATIYIKDNDRMAPQPNQSIELQYVGSFDPSGAGTSTCEIVVYDADSQRLFTTSAAAGFLDIIDFSNPESPSVVSSIDMNTYGGITCVAVKNGVIAVASPNADEQLNGSVVFFDTDGTFISQVTVGSLPDNITFTPDGTKVITADEGQPSSDYTTNDPEGSVSIIDITGGAATLTNANVTTLDFTSFNANEATLIAAGVRKVIPTSTLSQDMEPEYVAVSADSQKAWIALQESNAIAEVNLTNNTVTDIWALGTKDMSAVGNGFDISDENGEILIANWPIQAYYTPDAIATYSVDGVNYIITANEGDEKEYGDFEERTTIGSDDYMLDATAYPQSAMLKNSFNAGRMRVTNVNGNTDDDTDFDQMYCLGSRSFSIFNADTKEIVFDSGDDFEMYIANDPNFSAIFNADNEDNELKGRSRAKGPEPEGVTIATIGDHTFAFIGLERVGGVMVYDVTDPTAPIFVDYKNNRSTSAFEGDHAPEGITFISSEDSPNDKNYVVVANEISGTLTIFEVDTTNLSATEFVNAPKTFAIFPNPATDGLVYFNRVADIDVYDLNGKLIHSEKQALTINTTKMASGMYIIKTSEGIVKKLIVK